MSNCKVAFKDRTEALEDVNQTINRPQMLHHLQIHISVLFHTSTAFRMFFFGKNRNKCWKKRQPTHPQTDDLHLLVSFFGRSPNTVITAR